MADLPNVKQSEAALVRNEVSSDPTGKGYPAWPATGTAEQKFQAAEQIAHLLAQRPFVANPNPMVQVPKPMSADVLYASLTDTEVQAIPAGAFDMIHGAIEAGDRRRVKRLVNIAYRKGWIGQAKHNAIASQLDAKVDDPDWPAQVLDGNRLTKVCGRVVGGIAPIEVQAIMES